MNRRVCLQAIFVMPIIPFAQAALAQGRSARLAAEALKGSHPATYYRRAAELFGVGQRDDAVFIFYLGQLRFRVHLAARRGRLRPDADPAVFASLSETVGRPINEYAFGDLPQLLRVIDAVLAYDRANPDTFTPPASFAVAHATIRKGLQSMRRRIESSADNIRAQRRRNGLENRN